MAIEPSKVVQDAMADASAEAVIVTVASVLQPWPMTVSISYTVQKPMWL